MLEEIIKLLYESATTTTKKRIDDLSGCDCLGDLLDLVSGYTEN